MTIHHDECPDRDILADYAESTPAVELVNGKSALEMQAIRDHLQTCDHCRSEIARLDRSLAAVQSYFRAIPVVRTDRAPKRTRSHRRVGLVAAVALSALIAAILYMTRVPQPDRNVARHPDRSRETTDKGPPESSTNDSPQITAGPASDSARDPEIDNILLEASQIARLEATLQILDQEPALADRSLGIREILRDVYRAESHGIRRPM